MTEADAAFHDALARLAGCGYEFEGYLSNHGPMGSDALIELGASDIVPRWADVYRRRLREEPERIEPIDAVGDRWRVALGKMDRVADWTALFDRELREAPWETVLARWWPRLLPGLVAAATHGVIRTAHAVRGIDRADAPDDALLTELAHGMGYWAARYQELPVAQPTLTGARPVPQVIGSVAAVEPPAQSDEPGITAQLLLVDRFDGIDETLESAGAPTATDLSTANATLTQVTSAAARAYIEHPGPKISLVHSVTAPAAVKLVLPHLPPRLWQPSVAYSVQVSTAIVAMFATAEHKQPKTEVMAIGDLVDQVVNHGDEHVIKMTEACLREYRVNPDSNYLLAAEAAMRGIDHLF